MILLYNMVAEISLSGVVLVLIHLQSFSKPAAWDTVVLNHNSIDTSFFKQYASPPQSMLVSELE
jgi:hypothetical protein